MSEDQRAHRVGVLGAGQISQAAHFEACRKARNAELHAVCDVAQDLLERVAAIHAPKKVYGDYDAMISDPDGDAVIVAVADQFHVPMALKAVKAGKHVLVEKPMGVRHREALRRGHRLPPRVYPRGDGGDARAEGLGLRLDPPLHHDRRSPAGDRGERDGEETGG